MNVEPMTVRALRQALYSVQDQEMTVRSLRHALFAVAEQDGEATGRVIWKAATAYRDALYVEAQRAEGVYDVQAARDAEFYGVTT